MSARENHPWLFDGLGRVALVLVDSVELKLGAREGTTRGEAWVIEFMVCGKCGATLRLASDRHEISHKRDLVGK